MKHHHCIEDNNKRWSAQPETWHSNDVIIAPAPYGGRSIVNTTTTGLHSDATVLHPAAMHCGVQFDHEPGNVKQS